MISTINRSRGYENLLRQHLCCFTGSYNRYSFHESYNIKHARHSIHSKSSTSGITRNYSSMAVNRTIQEYQVIKNGLLNFLETDILKACPKSPENSRPAHLIKSKRHHVGSVDSSIRNTYSTLPTPVMSGNTLIILFTTSLVMLSNQR